MEVVNSTSKYIMATKEENIQKDTWRLNELESLGVSLKAKNELNYTGNKQSS
jgi:hypothetical protein